MKQLLKIGIIICDKYKTCARENVLNQCEVMRKFSVSKDKM